MIVPLIKEPPKPAALFKQPFRIPGLTVIAAALGFLLLGSIFFLMVGQPPVATFWAMIKGAFGDGYSLSETLVKTAPILLCGIAAALPARLGLISVGGEGQLYFGALFGTGLVLAIPGAPMYAMLPLMLAASAAGGALWALIPAFLKARMNVNETITTLLLNYVASLFVDFLVYGPWKDPNNLGWPATINFPAAAKLPALFGTRAHIGLIFGLIAAVALYVLTARTRWGTCLRLLRSNRRVAEGIGLSYGRQAILVVCLGGMLAGLAGICETSAIQGRLQSGISNGMGFSGFLVAWMAGGDFLRIIPLSLLLGGLLASGDSLQLFAGLPSSAALVLQGVLFASVLAAGSLKARKGGDRV
ncbi:MAG: transporter permease [Fibrobacteres bacterium]|nr:transporter permease [Fibrobacterota bacterium]